MKIGVILSSVREGRLGDRVGKFVMHGLAQLPNVEAELLDLREYPMPFYDDAIIPALHKEPYANDVANRWVAKIGEMDGFVVATAEYNHGYTAVLKNALDYVSKQWNDKPVAFVSYSTGAIGGARVVEQLRAVVSNLRLIDLPNALHLSKAQEILDEQGNVTSGPFADLLDKQLRELVEWTELLKKKRGGQM